MLSSQGRKLACSMATDQSAQRRMLVNEGRKLACFSARGAILHGPCSKVTDQTHKVACIQIRGASSHAFQPGAQACMRHGHGSERASSHACKRGAQARMLFSQGRKLAWTMRHSYGSEAQARMLSSQGRKLACNMATDQSAQARMLVNAGRKLACFSARGASLHGPCNMVMDERCKLACLARMLFSQGRKLTWTMQQCYGSEAQARIM
jgi:hypothetical protein